MSRRSRLVGRPAPRSRTGTNAVSSAAAAGECGPRRPRRRAPRRRASSRLAHDEDPVEAGDAHAQLVTGADGLRRLRALAVHPYMPRAACGRRGGAGLVDADRPEPAVDAHRASGIRHMTASLRCRVTTATAATGRRRAIAGAARTVITALLGDAGGCTHHRTPEWTHDRRDHPHGASADVAAWPGRTAQGGDSARAALRPRVRGGRVAGIGSICTT